MSLAWLGVSSNSAHSRGPFHWGESLCRIHGSQKQVRNRLYLYP